MKRFLLIILVLPEAMFPQQLHTVYMDFGSSVFAPLQKNNSELTGGSINNYTFYSTISAYWKVGIERRLGKSKKVYVSLPFALGSREQKFSYHESGNILVVPGPMDDLIGSAPGTQKIISTRGFISSVNGLKINYAYRGGTFFTGLNLNYDFCFFERSSTVADYETLGHQEFVYDPPPKFNGFYLNLSMQSGFSYEIFPNFSAGVNCEIFMFNLNCFTPYARNYQHFFNMNFGAGSFYLYNTPNCNSVIINAGARVQYSF